MGLASFFRNLFGSAKTSAEEMADKAEHIVDETIAKAKENAAPLIEKVEEYSEVAKEKVEQFSEKAEETIGEVIQTVKEKSAPIIAKAEEFTEEAKEKLSETIETAREKINSFTNDGSQDAEEQETTPTNNVEEDAD
jgi:ElaB/YqjD/DUF883 family membrane-anchored ribosome-binding protein